MIENIASEVTTAVETVKGSLSFLDELFEQIKKIADRKLSDENYLRAYYFEVLSNIELFNVLNLVKIRLEKVNSEKLRFVLSQFHTEIGATILFSSNFNEKSRLYEFLRGNGKIKNTKKLLTKTLNGKEVNVKGESFYENVLQAISFTVIKTEVLRKISNFTEEQSQILSDVQIVKRLTNIRERYWMIKEKLEEIPGIKEIAR